MIHFPMSSRVSEWAREQVSAVVGANSVELAIKWAMRANEQTDKWMAPYLHLDSWLFWTILHSQWAGHPTAIWHSDIVKREGQTGAFLIRNISSSHEWLPLKGRRRKRKAEGRRISGPWTFSLLLAHVGSGQARIGTYVLGHSLIWLLVCLLCSLICLLHPACFACELHCAHLFTRSLIPSLPSF